MTTVSSLALYRKCRAFNIVLGRLSALQTRYRYEEILTVAKFLWQVNSLKLSNGCRGHAALPDYLLWCVAEYSRCAVHSLGSGMTRERLLPSTRPMR